MPTIHDAPDVDDSPPTETRLKHPVLSARWLRNAMSANRTAFELEMRRGRRRLLDSRFDAFWKEMGARQA